MVVACEVDRRNTGCVDQCEVDDFVVFLIIIIGDGQCVILRRITIHRSRGECQGLRVGCARVVGSPCGITSLKIVHLYGDVTFECSAVGCSVGCHKQGHNNIVRPAGNRFVYGTRCHVKNEFGYVIVVDCACSGVGGCHCAASERLGRQADRRSQRLRTFNDCVIDRRDRDSLVVRVGSERDLLKPVRKVSDSLSRNVCESDINKNIRVNLIICRNGESQVTAFRDRSVANRN